MRSRSSTRSGVRWRLRRRPGNAGSTPLREVTSIGGRMRGDRSPRKIREYNKGAPHKLDTLGTRVHLRPRTPGGPSAACHAPRISGTQGLSSSSTRKVPGIQSVMVTMGGRDLLAFLAPPVHRFPTSLVVMAVGFAYTKVSPPGIRRHPDLSRALRDYTMITETAENHSIYYCGRCQHRWTEESTNRAVMCPICRNYSTIGRTEPRHRRGRR